MNRETAIETIRNYLKKHEFPKVCSNCGYEYKTLKQFIQETKHAGEPISYDAEVGDWTPQKPIGTMSMSNCKCGSTLTLSSKKMARFTLIRLLIWAKIESMKRNISVSTLLQEVRLEIDERELQES